MKMLRHKDDGLTSAKQVRGICRPQTLSTPASLQVLICVSVGMARAYQATCLGILTLISCSEMASTAEPFRSAALTIKIVPNLVIVN